QEQLPRHDVAVLVDIAHPRAEIAVLDATREPLVRGAVTDARDRDDGVRTARPVREMHEEEEPRVVPLRELRQPTVAVGLLELVLALTPDPVDFVQQQHAAEARPRSGDHVKTSTTKSMARVRIATSSGSIVG